MRPVSRRHRILSAAGTGVAALALLTGCATPGTGTAGDAPAGAATPPAPPAGEVIAQGTVMDVGGDVELCLAGVAESYPPQCSGLPMTGWSWEGVDGAETAGEVTWGAYAVQGLYDGESFTVTEDPIVLALYDPMAPADPTGGEPGTSDEATLATIQDESIAVFGEDFLSSWTRDGWLWVQVVWDDGSWQRVVDELYGDGVVVIVSALQAVEG